MKLKTETGEMLVLEEEGEARIWVSESPGSNTVLSATDADELIEKGELEMVAEDSDVQEADDPKTKKLKKKKTVYPGSGETEVMEDEEEDGDETDEDEDDEVEETSKKVAKEEIEIEVDVSEDVNALFEGQDLTEEFKAKTTLVFETAVKAKVKEQLVSIEKTMEAKLTEQTGAVLEDVSAKLNDYLDYMIEEWVEENKIAVEHGLKNQILEGFVSGLQGLFAEHYIEIPEEKYNVVDEQAKEIEGLKEQVSTELNKNVEARVALNDAIASKIVSDVTEGLTLTQAEKLKSLAEGVDFDSAEDYTEKLTTLKETYFPSEKKGDEVAGEVVATEVTPEVNEESENLSPEMAAIVATLSNTQKSIFGA